MTKRRISPTLIALLFFIILDTAAFYVAYLNRSVHFQAVNLSAPSPNFTWHALDGSTHTLAEFKGHVVVLHFWATWCPPCRDEFPKLLKYASEHKDVMFLTITSDDDVEKPKSFAKVAADTSGLTPPPANVFYAWDPTKAITYDQFLTVSYPESIIVDPKLNMRRKIPMPVDWDGMEINKYIESLKK